MEHSWLVTMPPLIVIIITIATRNVISSLAGGIIAACLIACNFRPLDSILLSFQRVFEESHLMGFFDKGPLDHVYTFSFLLFLGVLIQLMNHSGGIRAYTNFLLNYIKTPQKAQQTSLMLSSTLFIDDYVNNLTVGAIMRPVTDHFRIARVKLAFLLDSMSGPLCMLIPASSWVAFILAQMQASGINQHMKGSLIQQDALFAYLASIPYLLYPLLIVFSAWFIVSAKLSFGKMAEHEKIAHTTGNLYGGKEILYTPHYSEQFKGTLLDFILPISIFIISFLMGIAYSGNSVILGGSAGFIKMLQQADPFWALFMASLIAVTSTIILFLRSNYKHYEYIFKAFLDGFMLMKNSLVVLLLAWTLSTLLKNDLHTGNYLASLLPVDLPASYLPLLIFIICLVISASTGSVWGTIALMLPITIPLYSKIALGSPTFLNDLYPTLGALFSGSVAGSHFSPITDAMVMTSFSAGCYHLDHVRTQISYASSALIGTLFGYLALGLLPLSMTYNMSLSVCLLTGFFITSSLLLFRDKAL